MDEADLIPLSALQHYLFCPRQCGLIHVEQVWEENQFTAEGRLLHARTDAVGSEVRRNVRTVTAMPVRSLQLGVSGICDVVELATAGQAVLARPVEYKRGKPKGHRADEVQLCAQGIALEEMFKAPVPSGHLFYGETRRRVDVSFDDELRDLTRRIAQETRAMLASEAVPHTPYQRARCTACSLLDQCRPQMPATGVRAWLERQLNRADEK